MDINKYKQHGKKYSLKEMVKFGDDLRTAKKDQVAIDLSFAELVSAKYGESVDSLYANLGIDPTRDTISNLYTYGDAEDVRWLVPEIFRDAIRSGLKKSPIWNSVCAAEVPVNGLNVIMPNINQSDAAPRRVGEAETIPLGTVSVGQKNVGIYKVGRGVRITDEIKNYVSLDVVSIFLEDFGVKLGLALDTLAIATLLNGDQGDGSDSIPNIGTATGVPSSKAYKDFLNIWIRGSRMGRNFTTAIGGEAAALATLDLAEFKDRKQGTTDKTLNLRTPVPSALEYYVHGNIPANKELLVDKAAALLKLNAQPLMVESERIVSNQTEDSYASLTTGFSKMFRDASVLLDSGSTIGAAPMPSYFDVDPLENVTID